MENAGKNQAKIWARMASKVHQKLVDLHIVAGFDLCAFQKGDGQDSSRLSRLSGQQISGRTPDRGRSEAQTLRDLAMQNDAGQMGFSMVMGVPPIRWFLRESPTKMDDDWGYPPFMETSISWRCQFLESTFSFLFLSVLCQRTWK